MNTASDWRSSARILFAILFGINILNYLDRYILPAVAPSIQRELGLSDAQLGLLGTAFLLVYAVAAIPAGSYADKGRRTILVGTGVAIWSIATLATGFTRNFSQLFGVRAFLGIGEATYFPPSTTMLADTFPPGSRARVLSWNGLAMPIGVFLGFGLGGVVGEALGWRSAFFLTAVPGLILAALITRLREPRRGANEGLTSSPETGDWRKAVAYLLGIATVRTALASQALSFFVLGGVSFWVPTYLQRQFGIGLGEAGLLVGGLFVIGGGIGTIAGGYLADHLLARGLPSARLAVGAAGFCLAAPVILGAVATSSLTAFLILLFAVGGLMSIQSGPASALTMDVVMPVYRARGVALSLLLTHLFGDAFAPTALGALSDWLGSLQAALFIAPVMALAAGLVAFIGCPGVARDHNVVRSSQ